MDGGGRFRDNICIERCWKTAKYEEGYWKAYKSVTMRKGSLTKFFDRYNMRRPHQGIGDRTPDEVYLEHTAKGKGGNMNRSGEPLKNCCGLSKRS